MSIVDSHCHIHFKRIANYFEQIIQNAKLNNICSFICNSTCREDWDDVLQLSIKDSSIVPCIGIHPYFANSITEEELRMQLSSILKDYPKCQIGEIGLDKSRKGKQVQFIQQEKIFRCQLQISKEYHRIPMIHCVRCYGKILEILKEEFKESTPFLMHGYNGPSNMISDFIRIGGYISINASLFNLNTEEEIKKVLLSVPKDRLLVETDSPDMILNTLVESCLKDENQQTINEPQYIHYIIDQIAYYTNSTKEEWISQFYKNSITLFPLKN